jgi:hypothetical protein
MLMLLFSLKKINVLVAGQAGITADGSLRSYKVLLLQAV